MTTASATFSVIVNTNDRAASLRTLLRSLEHQSYPHFEVVIVVGPTRDNTLQVLSEYEGRVKVLHCPTANLGLSRNIGLQGASGDLVAFIDDDAVPSTCWLEQLQGVFLDPYIHGTGGIVYLAHPAEPRVQHRIGIVSPLADQVDVRSSWLENMISDGIPFHWVPRMMGTNMAYRRQSLLDIGGFDQFYEWVYDDSDIALRLVDSGRIVHPAEECVVYHIPASSRNRRAFSYNLRWWIQTKAAIYFSIKNGRTAGEPRRRIASRCLRLVHGHLVWSLRFWQQGRLSALQSVKMSVAELGSAANATIRGSFFPRQLLATPALVGASPAEPPVIAPFQNAGSASQPAVDPVTGDRASITLPDSPLRVCLLSSHYPPSVIEGVGRHTNLMARGLFELGHTVHVITRGSTERVSFYDGAYVHEIPLRLERYERYQRLTNLYYSLNHSHGVYDKVRRLMLNDGVQVVDSPVWLLDGLVTAISGRAPVVVRIQTATRQVAAIQDHIDEDARLIGDMEQILLTRAAHLVPNSKATLAAARRVYGLEAAEGGYSIIPHGIVPVAEEATRPFDISRDAGSLTVLFVGRLEKRKGIMSLLQAIPKVLQRVPNVRFVLAGADNSANDGFRGKTGTDYQSYFLANFNSAASRVQFLGSVSEESLQALYQSCDLFVAPSLYESFGLIYLEAMNYAKPVVACQAGGVPEVVDHQNTGLLVEPASADALAEAIISLLGSPRKLREMGLAARQRVLDRFTYTEMARSFASVYRRTIRLASAAESSDNPTRDAVVEKWEGIQ